MTLTCSVGEKRKLRIPAHLGYGERAMGDKIPANSALVRLHTSKTLASGPVHRLAVLFSVLVQSLQVFDTELVSINGNKEQA